jgi:hypothetical protein
MDDRAYVPSASDLLTIPVRTDAEVLARVRSIVDAQAAAARRLWLFFLNHNGMQSSVLVPIDDIPEFPDSQLVGNVSYIVSQVMADDEPGGSAVITLSRPGPTVVREMDLNWLRALRRGARKHQSTVRMFCLATPGGVLELSPARR